MGSLQIVVMRVALVIANLIALCSSKALNGESNQDFDAVCPESQDGYSEFVPHPTDCTLYYQCFGLTPILMSCPEGLFFDPTVDVCNWPDQVDCKQQTEAPETTTVEEETTTAEEEFSCESGWVASQNRKCYKYISSPLPADEANNYCKGLSNEGSLASIHDSDTNSLLNTLSNGSTVWLGGYRVEDGQDLWAWTDGSQWDFDNWNKNEPNDSGRNEDYVAMNWGGHPKTTWNDYPGQRSYPFICQQ